MEVLVRFRSLFLALMLHLVLVTMILSQSLLVRLHSKGATAVVDMAGTLSLSLAFVQLRYFLISTLPLVANFSK